MATRGNSYWVLAEIYIKHQKKVCVVNLNAKNIAPSAYLIPRISWTRIFLYFDDISAFIHDGVVGNKRDLFSQGVLSQVIMNTNLKEKEDFQFL